MNPTLPLSLRTNMQMVGMLIGLAFFAHSAVASDMELLALAQAEKSDAAVVGTTAEALSPSSASVSSSPGLKVQNEALRKHLIENVDIFGKNDISAIYILGPGLDDFEGQLLTRDFSRDPFFMQNIDREEFELKTILRDFMPESEKEKESESR